MNEFEIKFLNPKDFELYKSARLQSLKDSPESFGATYDQEVALSDGEWQTRLDLESRGIDALPLVASVNDIPVGLAWGFIHKPNLETSHIYQMWVSPMFRGRGIAKSLIRAIKEWAAERGCDFLALAVTTSNEAAVNLYKSLGFVATGKLEELRMGSALRVQPMIMELNRR